MRLLDEVVGGAYAKVIPGTSIVAVGADYYTDLTQTQQIGVAMHEALHIFLDVGDSGLAQWLGKFGFTYSGDININSQQMTEWIVGTPNQRDINGGCQNPKTP
jgi:hypothetical protein